MVRGGHLKKSMYAFIVSQNMIDKKTDAMELVKMFPLSYRQILSEYLMIIDAPDTSNSVFAYVPR